VSEPTLKVFVESERVGLPAYATAGAAGMDLQADIPVTLTLRPGERAGVPTGIRLAVPDGYEAQLRPRSGLAIKHGLSMVNTPATIDCDYRGIVHVLLINHGQESYTINPGERIAQMIIAPVTRVRVQPVASAEDLGETVRGEGGLGSTGV
jgi:dUTP pyrophosphatase